MHELLIHLRRTGATAIANSCQLNVLHLQNWAGKTWFLFDWIIMGLNWAVSREINVVLKQFIDFKTLICSDCLLSPNRIRLFYFILTFHWITFKEPKATQIVPKIQRKSPSSKHGPERCSGRKHSIHLCLQGRKPAKSAREVANTK